ncbi:MAG: hypothetical protein QNJ32_30610 [Xenococcaceae cyanobacterium MO_167.B27]|nr:hypothetical protein [Xenococcaceae cyanobacterium MO_167.B27]
MSHYFQEPSSFRIVNCKTVPGERARKHCRQWNSFVKQRAKLRKAGKIDEANQLEHEYLAKSEAREEQRLTTYRQKKKKK